MGNNGGTAFVRINGKRVYLGKFGTPEANQNYARCVAEWAVTCTAPGQPPPNIGTITVDSLTIAFLDHVQQNDHSHYHSFRSAVKILLQLYSGITADSFTPKCLTAVQHQFTRQVDKNGKRYSRQYCNTLTNNIRSMFRWGVSQELVSPMTADALKYVQPLRQGRTTAPESKPREDVPDDVVEATLPHLLPTVSAMVQVQRLATMRPNEVCRMRVGDIDMTGAIWLYRPVNHKGTWRGHGREIALGKPEQAILLPYLEGKSPDSAVFSPRTAMLEKQEKDAKRRKSKVPPNQKRRAERIKENPKRKNREHYDSKPYALSIKRAVIIANKSLPEGQKIPHWTPYQLRHAAITEITLRHGLDAARAVAGQRTINVTQHYNHADRTKAIEMAKTRGS
jgi:integrase